MWDLEPALYIIVRDSHMYYWVIMAVMVYKLIGQFIVSLSNISF